MAVDVVRTRILDGRIWVDANKDGLLNSGEELLEGIEVSIRNAAGGPAYSTAGDVVGSVRTNKKWKIRI